MYMYITVHVATFKKLIFIIHVMYLTIHKFRGINLFYTFFFIFNLRKLTRVMDFSYMYLKKLANEFKINYGVSLQQ